MTTPDSNFTAINPPHWLQRDMALAEKILPGVKTFVLFSDELGHWNELKSPATRASAIGERRLEFNKLANAHWRVPDMTRRELHDIAAQPMGSMRHDGMIINRISRCPVSDMQEQRTHFLDKPRHAVIMLPPRHMDTATFGWHATGLKRMAATEAIPQRSIFWHEFGHLRVASEMSGNVVRAKIDENEADHSMLQGCAKADDQDTASAALGWRTLACLTSDISPSASIYWNLLSLNRIHAPEEDEFASLLEIKLRAVGVKPHTDNPSTFIQTLMKGAENAEYQQAARSYEGFRQQQGNTQILLDNLQANEKQPYVFPHSAKLADCTFEAARIITTGKPQLIW